MRIAGNDVNGAFYDASIAGAGTDYSQQDVAQLSLSDIVCSATTTVTSVVGGFTAAMIGNAIRITGGGATSGYYFITARTDTNTITVDRTPGTVAAGTGNVGGAAITHKRLLDNANAVGDKVVAGNIVYIQGSGSDTPSSADYANTTGFYTPVSGSSGTARVQLIGETGRPRFASNGLIFYNWTFCFVKNLYLTTTSNNSGSFGIINCAGNDTVQNLVIDTNNQTGILGIYINGTNVRVLDTEIKSGTSSPTSSAGCHGINNTNYGAYVENCNIHHMRAKGILDSGGGTVIRNTKVWGCVDNSIDLAAALTPSSVVNCTVDAGQGHALLIAQVTLFGMDIRNSIFSNHTGSGKYGISIAAGTAAANDLIKNFVDYNCYYNNTSNFNAISAGAHDTQGTDPQYVSASTGDFTLGTNLKGLGYLPYLDPGAVQRQEAGAGGTTIAGTALLRGMVG